MRRLTAENVTYIYQGKYQKVEALKEVSCTFEEGKLYAVIGQSGSGKSTLLSILAGLGKPVRGRVLADGEDISQIGYERHRRKNVSVIYQALKKVGLAENLYRKFPAMLSGGEQQRVAIARALASEARTILADEPTGNLDSENGKIVLDILKDLVRRENYCVVIVTHDLDIAAQADVVYVMKDGRLTERRGEKP